MWFVVGPCAPVLNWNFIWRGGGRRRAVGGKFSEKNLHSPARVVGRSVGSESGRLFPRLSPVELSELKI